MNQISIVLVDDHDLMRQGLSQIIELEDDLTVIGMANDGESAIETVRKLNPDIVLLDINMPNMNGIEALKRIKSLNVTSKVIMLTIHDNREYLIETVKIGAEGYILKDADAQDLYRAIRNVHIGQNYIHPSISSQLAHDFIIGEKLNSKEQDNKTNLTNRELEVLLLIADGMNNKDIAETLFISEKTVKNHVSSIFKKIDVNDRTQAAIYAFKHSLKEL